MTKNKKQKQPNFAALLLNACALALVIAAVIYALLVRLEHPEMTETQLMVTYHWKAVVFLVVAIFYYLFAGWLGMEKTDADSAADAK